MLAPGVRLATLVLAPSASTSLAIPLHLSPRDVIIAPITQPAAGTVWKTGERKTATWDASVFNTTQLTNSVGKIILGTLTEDGNQHLLMKSPLASDFSLFDGSVSLTVPVVPTRDDYIVCLFGTSGDISAKFRIVNDDGSP